MAPGTWDRSQVAYHRRTGG